MAIKGSGYVKTSWAFEERPVTSAKLNSWDDRIEAALELVHFMLSLAWGGGNGVVRGAAANDLKVLANSPVSMSVVVQPGYAFVSKFVYKLGTATQTADIVAPVTNPRRDLIQARLETWDISVKTGTEAASPSLPSPDTNAIALAELYLRPGMTSIKNTDDATNGYIIDKRTFV
ncbi:MAG: hypothetical protein AAB353_09680 [Candidatus Hydrogenedentota bacterium]